ncbi:MAG: HIT family protein [Mycoplasmataceae bacterium]|nr:HIT family protein [Mycoplasmataceae bacterium]
MDNCIFCKIINKEIPANIIAENDTAIAFLDINPSSDGEVLVISKKHYSNLQDTPTETLKDVMSLTHKVVGMLDLSLKPIGYNYTSNQGEAAGQIIDHFHLHIIPKYDVNEGYKGTVVNKNIRPIDEIFKIIKSNN